MKKHLFSCRSYKNYIVFIILLAANSIVLNSYAADVQRLTVSVHADSGEFNTKKKNFVATRVTLTPGTENYNFSRSGGHAKYSGSGLSFGYELPDTSDFSTGVTVFGAFQLGNTIDRENLGILDPGGLSLLLPGVGVGPNGDGFELPPFANQTANTLYREDTDHFSFNLGMQKQLDLAEAGFTLTPFAGVEYKRFTSDTQFNGDVPLFLSNFAYDTDIEANSFRPFMGAKASYAITPSVSIIGQARYSYDLNFGEGTDSLFFTGFGTQRAKMKNNESSHSVQIEGGVQFKLKENVNLSLLGNYYSLGNIPVLNNRTGNAPSTFSYKSGNIISGSIRLSVQF